MDYMENDWNAQHEEFLERQEYGSYEEANGEDEIMNTYKALAIKSLTYDNLPTDEVSVLRLAKQMLEEDGMADCLDALTSR